ncbi:peptidoglycan-associated lipoprotein Pal [Novosphingobium sp. Gsoil 351]|uniref:peptidoglycan-associated lipoprotein Pal n=1 Tax=Novosphingobium sp. Gsoil 351 TaxID=2675225 RepID=UPI0012B46095|nr:peptidoglycan-associated lipoprotein Pal [Novosphingobium sp. Gsoil 351]QGN53664.1 peptidoglycan-associated lipoprotein Pal [Novosphingobium sp. Gsoil 351]
MIRPNATITALLLSAALVACAKKLPKELPPQPGDVGQQTTDNGAGDGTQVLPGSQADFIASVAADTIYFETDRYNVDAADGATLQSQAAWLARYPAKRIIVEGHADERGTRDYNLALGERRANAAKTYLVGLGVGAERIQTVSYGKERPVALGSDEASWARNRRAVTVTVQ